jgi:AAA ATPase domain/fungal STAND N-terminal Goodbye domain
VFGSPASIAYSALSVFIDAGIQYKNIFGNIEDLLSQIVVVLERFQIYKDNQADLPPQMIRVANKLLVAVVNICGICFKTLKKNKFKTFLGVALFNSDDGVQAQLARLKALEAEESQMKGTLSLVAAESTKRTLVTGLAQTNEGLGKLSGGMQRMEADLKDQKDLEELRERLSIPKDSNFTDEYHRYLDRVSSGNACGWLEKDAIYQAWADVHDSANDILLLSGEEGFGKSYVATAIIEDLTRRYPQRQQTANRVSVAYYYLTKTGKSAQMVSVYDVLRFLAWQVAQNDLFYRKDITAICKRVQHLGNTQAVWQQLFLDYAEEEATFFLVIDGIHDLESKEQDLLTDVVKSLAAQPKAALRLKLLLATRGPFVKSLRANVPSGLTVMALAERTKGDLERHIRAEADKMTIFQKQTTKVRDLKNTVCEGLTEAVNGSFLYADYLLREISGKYDPEEVMAIVNRAKESGNLSDSITDVIKKCNQTLSAKEVQDLNTLLLWVIYGVWSMDLGELEAILFLQRGESSLKPLYSRIKDEFSAFFTLNPDEDEIYACVNLKSDSIADYFKKISEDQSAANVATTKALSKGEIKIVQNFILKLCEQDIYDRLGLGVFFEQKLSESETTIAVDCQNAHALILLDCLRATVGDGGDETFRLRQYSQQNFVDHLKELDLDGVDPRYKAELGPLLVRLFKDAQGVEEASMNDPFINWSYDDEIAEEIMRLMRSSAVMKRVTAEAGEDHAWLTSVLKSETPASELFEPITKFLAKRWFEGLTVQRASASFLWLFGRYNKVREFFNFTTTVADFQF